MPRRGAKLGQQLMAKNAGIFVGGTGRISCYIRGRRRICNLFMRGLVFIPVTDVYDDGIPHRNGAGGSSA